ncbi:uncharacterized protein BJ212DRAFT_1482953 [Suillus subaureus]|uniref:BED-type domain-containing protein n=1 Tax=Suillus subaureus TaxID=48587 RepID=A0A9P7E7R1_9AGAM|nr:uncharacterized protein BJ212DRAFT_1482953 [Suillus subaureus]KAG1812887.1 hypothetical protein BJ212DRAFT_1482953 [Suillus subaureus]
MVLNINAKDITWFHDPDDNTPLPSTSCMSFPSPAIIIAGSRRSAHVPHPVSKLTDPNNAVLGKCKATHQVVVSESKDKSNEEAVAEVPEWDDDEDTYTNDADVDDAPPSTYQQTKDMGDTDCEGDKQHKSDLTADIWTIFTCEEKAINPDTGKEEDRHWCEVCKANGVAHKFSFLKGSVTSLHAHIRRHKDHTKLYKDCCCKHRIQPHVHVLPLDDILSNQKTLDSTVVKEHRAPAFTTAGLLDYIVELIVAKDEAFQLVDKGAFQQLLTYTHPGLSEKYIPCHHKIGWFTADNAMNNDLALKTFAKVVPEAGIEDYCHFSQAVGPMSGSQLLKQLKHVLKNANEDDEDLDELNVEMEQELGGVNDDNSDTSDALGKALALIIQIQKSPQAWAFFCQSCAEVNVPVLELLQWGVNHFVCLADDSDEVPNLQKKQYSDFKLSQSDWFQFSLLHKVLQEPANATQSFSSSKDPTVCVADALHAGLENLGKWSQKTDQTDIYFICLGLSPHTILSLTNTYVEQLLILTINSNKKKLEATFDQYHAPVAATPQPSPSPIPESSK